MQNGLQGGYGFPKNEEDFRNSIGMEVDRDGGQTIAHHPAQWSAGQSCNKDLGGLCIGSIVEGKAA